MINCVRISIFAGQRVISVGSTLATFPNFLAYFLLGGALTAMFVLLYANLTPYREIALIRAGNVAAAIALSSALIGFVIPPLASVIAHSAGIIDLAVWGTVALAVQLVGFIVTRLSRPPANGRWNGLFAWDEGCGGKHGGKIEAHSGCCGTGRIARPVEIGAPRRGGPGAGDPVDAGGAARRGDRRGSRGSCQHGAQLARLLCAWRGGGAAAAPETGTAGQDRAACRSDRRGDPGRRYAP